MGRPILSKKKIVAIIIVDIISKRFFLFLKN